LKARYSIYLFLVSAVAVALQPVAAAQDFVPTVTNAAGRTVPYTQPSAQVKLNNYFYEAFGPNPAIETAFVAGWHQARRNPPDWREGWAGYGERYASDYGNSVINISTRYALAKVFDEDTLYYRCTCKGVGPRLKHAIVASVFVHQGADGHRAFALPAIVAPYVANMAAVYGWYPSRYGAKDAFRMGNNGLLWYFAGNIGLEFLSPVLHAKRNSWIDRLHFDNRHLAPETEPGP
jgi:hypothetical protein